MKINIINKSQHPLPEHKTAGAAGLDLTANLESPVTLEPLERALIPTGLFLEIPQGFEGQIRPRSGWAIKHGITCLNSPGTIDSDYRGEVKVILANISAEKFTINNGDRIAQLVITKHETVEFNAVEELENTARGEGGFGSTGKR
ncbi:Deoxyuridine 5'-triphosphate nucleotidohydrolase [Candidatus Ornithobacterium hominis]|uniref:Deoxyuridine 5'-triphosphate nucleotidohydrolase n=1 Tax=Candidatus Ornithobacterium hominis TaxID=2497989 RepID=A0A383TVV9_9FLAO|nr:dUTP diphosphatase [Candidatus Ornithobacterium hominis]MCT7903793.1 dUTP diphosphatase [Candidatus Ornithobacterium hominis]SZD71136.1 Deoxyuridine 5'-triphosphate nucleotidohydrolase [Candidatus Ornithobacterium hominis]